jgi:hypothetical protein
MNGIQSILQATRRGAGSLKIVMATGLFKTAAGVVEQKTLEEEADGLRAYLTVRLRSARAASDALGAIAEQLEQGPGAAGAPSRRAALFLAARNQAEYEKLFGEVGTPGGAVPWAPPPPGRPVGWSEAIDELRRAIGDDEAELLELHHARNVRGFDLAFVLGTDVETIERRLEAAEGFAKLLLRDVADVGPKGLKELFADTYEVLPPSPEEQRAEATPKFVAPLPDGTVIADRYELVEKVGGGEFAYVYRARDIRVPGHMVALKLLHRVSRTEAAREGAIRELSLIASAFHPSLVQFKDHGWFEDRLWFVMPFYVGQMLLDRLESGPLPLPDAFAHFARLAQGLQALHEAGIRHQDIKPENIFLVELSTGRSAETLPVLLDLGVASPSGENALAGTPMYFPPEVATKIFDEDDPTPLTPKADVFALALSLLHAIEDPDLSELEGVSVETFLERRAEVSPGGPRLRRHRWLAKPFSRWLAKDPAARPTAGELAEELLALRRRALDPSGGILRSRALGGAAFLVGLLGVVVMGGAAPTAPTLPPAATPPRTARLAPDARVAMLQARLDEEATRVTSLERALGDLRLENHLQEVEVEDAQEREAEALTALTEARAELSAAEAARDAARAEVEAAEAEMAAAEARVAEAEEAAADSAAAIGAATERAERAERLAAEGSEALREAFAREAEIRAAAAQRRTAAEEAAAARAAAEAEVARARAAAQAEIEAARQEAATEAQRARAAALVREAEIREAARQQALDEARARGSQSARAEEQASQATQAELEAARAAAAEARRELERLRAESEARIESARRAALEAGSDEASAAAARDAAAAAEEAAEARISALRESMERDVAELRDLSARELAEAERRHAFELAEARDALARARLEVSQARQDVAAATERAGDAERDARRAIREVREAERARERAAIEAQGARLDPEAEARRRRRLERRQARRQERREEEMRTVRAVLREIRARRRAEREAEAQGAPEAADGGLVTAVAETILSQEAPTEAPPPEATGSSPAAELTPPSDPYATPAQQQLEAAPAAGEGD